MTEPLPVAKLSLRVLALAWPVLIQQFLHLAVGLSDQFLAGQFQPPDSSQQAAYLAALTTANYAAWFLSSFIVLVSVGSTALVARCVGAQDRALADRATNQSIVLALGLGATITVVGLLALPTLVDWLQLRGDAGRFAADFLRPMLALVVFQVVESAGIACLTGAGDTRSGLWVMGSVAVLNVPLAWGLCFGVGPVPALGFEGIALGTAISHVLGGTAVLVLLARGRAGLHLRATLLWPDPALMHRILRVSVPAAVDSMSVIAGQFWFLSIVNSLGATAAGAHGIALRWEALGFLSGHAFGIAAMALVGQYLGAGQPREAARSGWLAFAMGAGVMSLMGAIFFTFAPQMFAVFCPRPDQQEVVAVGVPVLRLIAFAMPALAGTIIFTAALRGAGDTRVPVLFTWIGFLLVRIPLAYLLTRETLSLGTLGTIPGYDLGLLGAWVAMLADLLVRGLFFVARFASGRWQYARV
jgi:putative MATE family efflux protein